MPQTVQLCGLLGSDWKPVTRLSTDGVPRQRFVKEVIRRGKFVKHADDIEFEVNDDVLRHWPLTFSAMKANGVKVPIPMDRHVDVSDEQALRDGKKTQSAGTTNAGWIDDVFEKDGSLFVVADIIGDDAIRAVARNDVSLNSPPELVDGAGNRYTRPISHVALVPNPTIPGLGNWIPLAASQGATRMKDFLNRLAKTLSLSLAASIVDDEKKLSEAVDAGLAAILKENGELKAKLEAAEKAKGTPAAPAAPAATVAASSDPKPLDPLVVKVVGENRVMKLDALVAAGKITKAVRDEIHSRFIGADNKALAASLSASPDGSDFDFLIKSHQSNDPVKLGEKSAGQTTVALGDPNAEPKPGLLTNMEKKRAEAKARGEIK